MARDRWNTPRCRCGIGIFSTPRDFGRTKKNSLSKFVVTIRGKTPCIFFFPENVKLYIVMYVCMYVCMGVFFFFSFKMCGNVAVCVSVGRPLNRKCGPRTIRPICRAIR